MAVRRQTGWGAGTGTLGWGGQVSSYGRPGAGQTITSWQGGRPIYGQPKPPRATRETAGGRKPTFGTFPTMTPEQQTILSRLMGQTAQQPQYQPVPVPTEPRPTYGAVGLGGAGERGATLSRMMAVSPGEEAAAIERMSAAGRQEFQRAIGGIRGGAGAIGTAWSTMRAGEEAREAGQLSERLAGMGEQYRMQRRGQAMEAAGLSAQEALGGAGLGMQRFGMQMQPYMQAQQLGVQAGLQAQQLGVQQQTAQQGMLASLLGIPMMGVYSYPGGQQRRVTERIPGGVPRQIPGGVARPTPGGGGQRYGGPAPMGGRSAPIKRYARPVGGF